MSDITFSPVAATPWLDYLGILAFLLLALLGGYALFVQVAVRMGRRASVLGGGSLRKTLAIGLTLIGVVPTAATCLLLAERSATLRQQRIASEIHDTTHGIANDIDRVLEKHRAGIASAAEAISLTGDFAADGVAQWLRIFHANYPDFLTMLATDADGTIVAATSLQAGLPARVHDLDQRSVEDRAYFDTPMREGGTFVSRVFKGRGLGQDPIVAVSAPFVDASGVRVGVVEGSLDLGSFSRLKKNWSLEADSTVLILDAQYRVIYSSVGAGFAPLQPLADDPLLEMARSASWGDGFAYQRAMDGHTERFAGAIATSKSDWSVLIQRPLTEIESQIAADYRVGAGLLTLAVVLSLLIGDSVLRRVRRATDSLRRTVDAFTLDGNERVSIPVTTPAEFVPIFARMKTRSKHLHRTHQRLQTSIETGERLSRELIEAVEHKESEIAARTADLKEANQTLQELSRRDALTGIPNRRAFDAFAQRVWRLGARENTPVALIMIDIDHFKSFNDTLGHQPGDECLRQVATALHASASRPMDLVARYGGEEFGAVLAATTADEACVVAERMRQAVEACAVAHPAAPSGIVTVSIGVAAAQPRDGGSPDTTLTLADDALYVAKKAGRNRIGVNHADGARLYQPPQQQDPLPVATSA